MGSQESNTPLEEQYIKRVLAKYNRAGDDLLVRRIINSLSGAVTNIIHNNNGKDVDEDLFTDILDHVEDQSIMEKHPRIMNILEEFIKAKIEEILNIERDQTQNTKLAKEETIEDILNSMRKLKGLVEEYTDEIRSNKQTISEMEGTLDNINSDVETVRGVIDELKAEFEGNVETIEEVIKEFNNKKNILIEKQKFKQKIIDIKLPQSEISEIRQIIDNIYIGLDNKILGDNDVTEIQKKKLIDEYIGILKDMFEGNEQLTVTNTIEFMINYIINIISSEEPNKEKRKFLRHNLFKTVDTGYLKNKIKAIRMLKLISIIKINELLKEDDEQMSTTVSYIPEKIRTKVLLKLGEILKKFGISETLNKTTCNNFIINLDDVTSKLLECIVEKKSIDDFKVTYVIPILEELKIPAESHDNFMEIVDLYYVNSRATIKELSIDEKKETSLQINNHLQAQAHLKDVFDKCDNAKDLDTCNFVSQYVINNISLEISKTLSAIIEDQRQKKEKNNDPNNIIIRIHKLNPSVQKQPNKVEEIGIIPTINTPIIVTSCQSYIKDILSRFLIPNRIKKDFELFIYYYYYYSIGILIQNKEIGNRFYNEAKNRLNK